VQPPKLRLRFRVQPAGRDDQEVAVAGRVATAEGERAREIDAHEVRAQDRTQAADEVAQEIV
jgi:hypothetical protein